MNPRDTDERWQELIEHCGRMEERTAAMMQRLDNLEAKIIGNGVPGLLPRIQRLEDSAARASGARAMVAAPLVASLVTGALYGAIWLIKHF